MKNKRSQYIIWVIHGFLIVLMCLGWFQFSMTIKNNNECSYGINYIEYLNSSVQRVTKLEMLGSPNDELVHHLNNVIFKLDSEQIYGDTSSFDTTVTDNLIVDMKENWQGVYEQILEVRDGADNSELLFASERFYNTAIGLTTETGEEFRVLSNRLIQIQVFLIIVLVLMVSVVFFNIYRVVKELGRTKKLSEKMFIDSSTGLFNRSKCQEMLKDTTTPNNLKSRIMVMIDLNDLKITNDKFGHQVGDELISSFAKILKQATKVHNIETFVGRYGGDEFMVYYPSADEDDVKLYIDEVGYLSEQFNLKSDKYQISYASGYSVFGEDRSDATIRDLFNEADEKMYANKARDKAKLREKLKSQGIEYETVEDERLVSLSNGHGTYDGHGTYHGHGTPNGTGNPPPTNDIFKLSDKSKISHTINMNTQSVGEGLSLPKTKATHNTECEHAQTTPTQYVGEGLPLPKTKATHNTECEHAQTTPTQYVGDDAHIVPKTKVNHQTECEHAQTKQNPTKSTKTGEE